MASGAFPVTAMLAIIGATPIAAQKPAAAAAASSATERAAVQRLRTPAAAGDAEAQFELGQAYRRGRGVAEDRVLAETWLRRAAVQGHVRAGDNLGLVLFQANKKTEATPWLEKSATRGEPRAQLVLGTMLFNGDTVTRNYPRAYALVLRATGAGLKPAAETLTQMDKYISPQERQDGVALASQMGNTQVAVRPSKPVGAHAAETGRAASPTPARALAPAPSTLPARTTAPTPAPVRTAAPTPVQMTAPAVRSIPVPDSTAAAAVAPAAAALRPAPLVTPIPLSSPISTRRYRVQLGAFRDVANARALWSRVSAQVGGTASYVEGGGVTRLQVGPYATAGDASRACVAAKRAGADCAVLGS